MRQYKKPKKWLEAYHIADYKKRKIYPFKGYEDGWEIGEARHVKGRIRICGNGYHSSPTIQDTWYHGRAYGKYLCKVLISRPYAKTGYDRIKQVSRWRKLVCFIKIPRVLGEEAYYDARNLSGFLAQDHVLKLEKAIKKAEERIKIKAKAKRAK